MKLSKKILFLILLLIIPIGLILFLKNFGKNEYKLPVYFAEDSIEVLNGQYKVTAAYTVPDFTLEDQDGNSVRQADYRGYIYVVDFFFTRCGSICPRMTTQLTRVQDHFEHDPSVKLLSITVDPKHDTAAVLKTYAQSYGAIPGKWSFATGEKDSIYTLAQKGYYLSAMEDEEHPIDFIHSDKLVLVDKRGWIRGYYSGTDPKDVDKLITEIKVLQEIEASEANGK
jgi:protein SCO1/2